MRAWKSGSIWALAAVVALAVLPSPARAAGMGVNLHGGTLGLGLDVDVDFSDSVGLRAGFNRLHMSESWEDDDLDYDADLEFDSVHALLDWHPFRGKFRFTGGVMAADHGLEAGADVESGEDIGDGNATQDGRLEAEIEYDDVSPYLGVGWDRHFSNSAFALSFDVGVLAQGNPEVELRETDSTGASQQNLDEEEEDIEDEWSDWDTYPVVQISLSYRF